MLPSILILSSIGPGLLRTTSDLFRFFLFFVEWPQYSLQPLATVSAHVPDSSGTGPRNSGTLSDFAPSSFHDRYDRYDHTPSPSRQHLQSRQSIRSSLQRPFTPQEHPAISALSERDARSTPNSQRSLRRTSRLTVSPVTGEARPRSVPSPADSRPNTADSSRRSHLAAVSTGISPRLAFAAVGPAEHQDRRAFPHRAFSQDLSEDEGDEEEEEEEEDEDDNEDDQGRISSASKPASASGNQPATGRAQNDTHPAVHISKRTHNAILFAIEGLTHPYKLSPDYEEEAAEMADLLVEGAGSHGNGNGMPLSRPQMPAPAPTSSPRSNIRGPRMIMQERQEREARKAEQERIERERLERSQAEQDARVLAVQKRQATERAAERERATIAAAAAAAAAVAAVPAAPQQMSQAHPGMFSSNTSQAVDPATQRRQQRAEQAAAASSGQLAPPPIIKQQAPPTSSQPAQQQQPSQQRPARVPQSAQTQLPSQQPSAPPPAASGNPGTSAGPAGQAQQPPPPLGIEGGDMGQGGSGASRPRTSFPHAFERWEALSAHWEGLTSFWIRQLQQRSEEINQDPLNRQLARQVTDLSAAGANLFHAVVELQRLRASSERKFQRWFFEMRSDMERNTEVQAMLEATIQEERRSRAEAIREAIENERSNSKIQKQLAEMRKELAISKDEARRAWEELGRREQEERDRLIALQEGHPTIVGGVQVVPMLQGQPTRPRASSSAGHDQQPQQQQQQQQQQAPAPPVPQPPQAQPPQQVQPAPQHQHQHQHQHQQQHVPPSPPQQGQQQPQPHQVQQQKPASALEQLPSQTHRYQQQQPQQPQQQQPVYSQAPVSPSLASTAGGEYYQQPQGQATEGAPLGSDETYEGKN